MISDTSFLDSSMKYQDRQNLTYIKQEPAFLQRMKADAGVRETSIRDKEARADDELEG